MPNNYDYYQKKEDPYKPKLKRRVNGPLTFFLVIVAIIFIMSVFFKVSRIEVEGNSIYTDDEIIEASGITTGDNLFFINGIAAGSRVAVKLPYIDSVQINRGLPNLVTIKVTESKAVGYVTVDDELWSVSSDGKFLSEISEDDSEYIASISGISVSDPATGEHIKAASGEESKLAYLTDILYQIQARGMYGKVTAIDMSDVSNPTFEYDSRFLVKLGAMDDTEYKFGKLLSAVNQLTADDAGTLDLSTGDNVVFNPN
jgi:cell division protein FtsQ